jgi:hypothetical protein
MKTTRKTPTIHQGRIQADIKMTTEEIEHSQELHRWYVNSGNKEEAAKHLKNVRRREEYLKKLRNEA